MYNRYIQKDDGSFQRTKLPEPEQQPLQSEGLPPLPHHILRNPGNQNGPSPSVGIGSFFRNLLPNGLDTEDLIVVLLLLLMGQESGKDSNKALLTLGAYLFL